MVLKLLVVLYYAIIVFADSAEETQDLVGCVKCHHIDDKKINVHLIPHSHDDLGWRKTVDQYYYGERNYIQPGCVKCIITTMVNALTANPDRRFIQVETAFFWKWWKSQKTEMRKKFKKLVDNGQIELVNGAWSMNDEACTNYQSIIDQFTLGLRTLKSIFGKCGMPRVGWQIDPFGHSREHASILAQLGYSGIFIVRLDHNDKLKREQNKELEFIWQGSVNLPNSTIFGSIFPSPLYFSPSFMIWDDLYNVGNVDDDPNSPGYNLDYLKKNFRLLIKKYSQHLQTNNVLISMGGDFYYQKAEENYSNMDKFIRGFRNDTELNVIYSTPSCYMKGVHNAAPSLRMKTDDFFPFSSDSHTFWAGYFTSRPNSKRFERIGHNILQVAKQLNALSSFTPNVREDYKYPSELEDIMGILQHHDAITGTEQQHVVNDYVKQLTRAIVRTEKRLGEIISKLLNAKKGPNVHNSILELSSCLLANVSVCKISQENDRFVVAVYNPLSWSTLHYVRLPVPEGTYKVTGSEGTELSELVPNYLSVFNFFPVNHVKPAEFDLVFAAKNIPPMGLKLFYVDRISCTVELKENTASKNTKRTFEVDKKTNILKSITLNGITLDITQNFYYYKSDGGTPTSGAYIFRPSTENAEALEGTVQKVNEYDGNLSYEFQQRWTTTSVDIAQSIRWYKTENTVEFDWTVGNINLNDNSKEIIIRYTIKDLNNNKIFYTDANGREMITRKLNFRPTYDYNAKDEPVSSNYYPVTSKIVLKDKRRNVRVAILTDRSQGGTSLREGEIELMVHRRLRYDDGKGVENPLNETEYGKGVYVRGSHHIIFGKATDTNPDGKTTAAQERILAQKKLLQPWIGLASTTVQLEELKKNFNFQYSTLRKSLPENVNIMTLEHLTNNYYLLRLEHIMEKNEDPTLSTPVEIDLKNFSIIIMLLVDRRGRTRRNSTSPSTIYYRKQNPLPDVTDVRELSEIRKKILTIDKVLYSIQEYDDLPQTLFQHFQVVEIEETTLAGTELMKDYQHKQKFSWKIVDKADKVYDLKHNTTNTLISLTPMQIRTFVVTLCVSKEIPY